jgi:hypothetical protein
MGGHAHARVCRASEREGTVKVRLAYGITGLDVEVAPDRTTGSDRQVLASAASPRALADAIRARPVTLGAAGTAGRLCVLPEGPQTIPYVEASR